MANSIRTPKPGTPKHIAEAVDNEEWQKFRLSLKGKSTNEKLTMLYAYYYGHYHAIDNWKTQEQKLVEIRVDNYLKALARGGQVAVADDYIRALVNHRLVIKK